MSDKALTKFMPLTGDRVRLRSFLKTDAGFRPKTRRLVQILRKKLEEKRGKRRSGSPDSSDTEEPRLTKRPYGNKNAAKQVRTIEIGWIHKSGRIATSTYMKKNKGGGTRKFKISKEATKKDLIEAGKKLFFPNGESSKGKWEEFDADVWNFRDKVLDDNITVGQLYEETKMPLLRYYLATTPKIVTVTDDEDIQSDSNDISDPGSANISNASASVSVNSETAAAANSSLSLPNTISDVPIPESSSAEPRNNVSVSSNSTNISVTLNLFTNYTPVISNSTAAGVDTVIVNIPSVGTGNLETISSAVDYLQSDLVDPQFNVFDENPSISEDIANYDLDDSGVISFPHLNVDPTVFKIKLHRGHVMKDFFDVFIRHKFLNLQTNRIEDEMILPNGTKEAGEDNGGILRDAIAEFWATFYSTRTIGNNAKVPAICHTMTSDHWKACAKVILLGYKQENYFPVQLSFPFLDSVFHGTDGTNIDAEELINSFMQYVPDMERQVFNDVLQDYDKVEYTELLDALDSHDVRIQPNKNDIKEILRQVAHKELVQAPAFIAECWQSIFRNELRPILKSSIKTLQSELQPTCRRVLQALEFPEQLTVTERETSEYLKKYIKSLSEEKLQVFLRFVTGKYTIDFFLWLYTFITQITAEVAAAQQYLELAFLCKNA